MYDVASRTIIVRSTTGQNVGPSTYVLCNPNNKKNPVPFLSSCARSPALKKLNTDAIYDVRGFNNKIRNCSSLKSTSQRFVYSDGNQTPGPTKYNPIVPKCKKCPKLDPTKPKLYVCKVPHAVTVTAPSVPGRIDENGYDLDPDGNIIKVPPDEPIPEDINIPSQFPGAKGCRWARRTSERWGHGERTPGPGPAGYSAQIPKCLRYEADERYREMARLFSFVPRFLEAQEMKAQKEALPGPGTYDISTAPSVRSKSINPRPFISQSARFASTVTPTPSPTKYKICDCSTKQRQFSTKCAPFGFEAARFQRKKSFQPTPGPASYEIKSPLQEKLDRKKNAFALFRPPFNNTAKRVLVEIARDAACTPAPVDYPEDTGEVEDDSTEIYNSVFMSAVERFSPDCKWDALGPTSYNVSESFSKNRDRKSYHTGTVPFNSSGPRSTTPAVRLGFPCPGDYAYDLPSNTLVHHFNLTPRFKEPDETPGPGSYNVHSSFLDSAYAAYQTHNLRLKENVLRKKLRLPPKQAKKRWLSSLNRKKLLRWFDIELDYEEKQALLIRILFDKPV